MMEAEKKPDSEVVPPTTRGRGIYQQRLALEALRDEMNERINQILNGLEIVEGSSAKQVQMKSTISKAVEFTMQRVFEATFNGDIYHFDGISGNGHDLRSALLELEKKHRNHMDRLLELCEENHRKQYHRSPGQAAFRDYFDEVKRR